MMERRSFLSLITLCAAIHGTASGFEGSEGKGVDASRFTPLAAGIRRASLLTVYEGLPHQRWESEELKKELATKKTIRLHGYPFYEKPLPIFSGDVEPLRRLCSAAESYRTYREMKLCGGYHPDYALVWKDGGVSYDLLVCLGCHEMKLFGPKMELLIDLRDGPAKHLEAILKQYHQQRPQSRLTL